MENFQMITKVITHDGVFHADEVFAIALLKEFVSPFLQIERTRNPETIANALQDPTVFVLDLGLTFDPDNLNFDHHQNKGGQATNMLILNWLRETDRIENELAKELHTFMKGISDFDTNEGEIHQAFATINPRNELRLVSHVVAGFNRNPTDVKEQRQAFSNALEFASAILQNEIHSANERIKAVKIWESKEKMNNCLVFDEFCPIWKEKAKHTHITCAVMPTGANWSCLSIDSEKHPLPTEQEIKELLGETVTDFVFAHKGRFTAGFLTKESAVKIGQTM
jgi:uncharacterized UPF0160 family protein